MTLQNLLDKGKACFVDNNKTNQLLDTMLLMEYVLNCDRTYILLNKNEEVDEGVIEMYLKYIDLRIQGKPLQHITQSWEFMGIEFYVNEHTLIPRRETEELVELALRLIEENKHLQVLDIGTGTGCIPIALCSNNDHICCTGIDIAEEALKVATYNGDKYNSNSRIQWLKSDLFDALTTLYYNRFDMIISNPPYIPTEDIGDLMIEVKGYEPIIALDGGVDGLDYYRIISQQGKRYLKSNGHILFEVGHNQCDSVTDILKQNGYRNIMYKKDYSGIKRMVYAMNER